MDYKEQFTIYFGGTINEIRTNVCERRQLSEQMDKCLSLWTNVCLCAYKSITLLLMSVINRQLLFNGFPIEK